MRESVRDIECEIKSERESENERKRVKERDRECEIKSERE